MYVTKDLNYQTLTLKRNYGSMNNFATTIVSGTTLWPNFSALSNNMCIVTNLLYFRTVIRNE